MDYKPKKSDKKWLLRTLNSINQEGMWIVPATKTIYTVDHECKTLWAEYPNITEEFSDRSEITKIVANAIGWKIQKFRKRVI